MDKSRQHKRTFTRNIICFLVLFFILIFALHKCFSEGVTPLMKAAADGNVYRLKSLIEDGADVNAQSKYGWTALMFAAWWGHEKSVVLLLDAGADPNVMSKAVPSVFETTSGPPPSTALTKALHKEHIVIAHILLDRGARIDADSLAEAGYTGDVSFFKKLPLEKLNLNQRSKHSFCFTPLCAAAKNGKLDLVKWLIKNGAKINLVTGFSTPLESAIKGNHPEVVKYLLEHGAKPNLIIDISGFTQETPLEYAVFNHRVNDDIEYNRNLKIIKLLLDYGADKNFIGKGNKFSILEKVNQDNASLSDCLSSSMDQEVRARITRSWNHHEEVTKLLNNHKLPVTNKRRMAEPCTKK